MSVGQWLTPDAPGSGFQCRLLRIPDSEEHVAIVNGALADLAYPRSFEQFGTQTPEETAALFAQMYEDYLTFRGCMIGTIFAHANATAPLGSLPCDGATHNKSDYPLLYDSLASAFILSPTQFKCPDLRGQSIIGVGQGSGLTNRTIGQSGGEEAHTLSTSEIPSHQHTYITDVGVFAFTPGATPTAAGQGTIATGATGGGGAHNNMHPWRALNYAIWAQ